jgi:SNF2 family DNA or RNA helicase
VVKSGQPITAVNEAAVRTKFIQISLGAIYDANHTSHVIDARHRIDELRAVIEEAPGKILIFVPLTNVVNLLYKELGPKKDAKGKLIHKGWSREIINGNTSQSERSRIFRSFQEDAEPRILVADPGTMAHGLDLFAARTVVWYGATDKTELYLQACKRAHRPGQKFPVTVVQMVSNPLEREIFRRLENNESMQGALLDAVRKGEL